MAHEVADSLSNANEHIEQAAKAVGRGEVRRKVFEAIYHHKAKVKSVAEIAERTGLTRTRVLQEGQHLVTKGIVKRATKDGDTAYQKIDFFHGHKRQILNLAGNPKMLAKLPTKRKVVVSMPKSVTIPSSAARVERVTVDDIASFSKVRRIKSAGTLPSTISETQFKNGVQAIIGEPGKFKDWGGEKSDLYTTRLRLTASKRLAAAFAFKGPGLQAKLVPGRMGKNGDQALRLFQEEADVFFVQHWREIDSSVLELLRSLATAKSVMTGKKIWYGVIDGQDSHRLYLAYPKEFRKKPRKARSGNRP